MVCVCVCVCVGLWYDTVQRSTLASHCFALSSICQTQLSEMHNRNVILYTVYSLYGEITL